MSNRADNFDTHADGASPGTPSDAGSAWEELVGGWAILKPAADGTAYNWNAIGNSVMVLETSAADGDVQAVAEVVGPGAGLAFRASDASNLWIAIVDGTGLQYYKKVAGSFAQVGTTTAASVADGDTIKVTLSGSSIQFYKNGVAVGSGVSDAFNATATKHGLWSAGSGTHPNYDDFAFTAGGGAPAFVAAPPRIIRQAVKRAAYY